MRFFIYPLLHVTNPSYNQYHRKINWLNSHSSSHIYWYIIVIVTWWHIKLHKTIIWFERRHLCITFRCSSEISRTYCDKSYKSLSKIDSHANSNTYRTSHFFPLYLPIELTHTPHFLITTNILVRYIPLSQRAFTVVLLGATTVVIVYFYDVIDDTYG